MRSAPPGAGVQSFSEAAGPEAQMPVGLGAGESAGEAAPAAPAHEPTTVTGETLAAGVAARLNAWWESGGKVLIVSDGSLKNIRAAGGRELVPRGGAGWVLGLAPADFKDERLRTPTS